ncbi:hypothetical protein B0H63DRAFT_529127 [Podospora didyma]|uniref:Uncharacterized protein n=1 Tax=Podospora didyma TaxID=330526 RepID=A0AAE0N3D9_9PEZI|nr:hypothetical protein B0H63DRAFT_529127 [Podospora didyma]
MAWRNVNGGYNSYNNHNSYQDYQNDAVEVDEVTEDFPALHRTPSLELDKRYGRGVFSPEVMAYREKLVAKRRREEEEATAAERAKLSFLPPALLAYRERLLGYRKTKAKTVGGGQAQSGSSNSSFNFPNFSGKPEPSHSGDSVDNRTSDSNYNHGQHYGSGAGVGSGGGDHGGSNNNVNNNRSGGGGSGYFDSSYDHLSQSSPMDRQHRQDHYFGPSSADEGHEYISPLPPAPLEQYLCDAAGLSRASSSTHSSPSQSIGCSSSRGFMYPPGEGSNRSSSYQLSATYSPGSRSPERSPPHNHRSHTPSSSSNRPSPVYTPSQNNGWRSSSQSPRGFFNPPPSRYLSGSTTSRSTSWKPDEVCWNCKMPRPSGSDDQLCSTCMGAWD